MIQQQFQELKSLIQENAQGISRNYEMIGRIYEEHGGRLEGVEGGLTRVEGGLTRVEGRLTRVEVGQEQLSHDLRGVAEGVDRERRATRPHGGTLRSIGGELLDRTSRTGLDGNPANIKVSAG